MTAKPPPVVIDASVAVKWFVSEGESGTTEAAALLARHASDQIRLVAPALMVHELMGVFVRRLDRALVSEALDAFFDAGIRLMAPDRALMLRAACLAERCQLSAFDAPYAATADALNCTLATADRGLANALADTLEILAV